MQLLIQQLSYLYMSYSFQLQYMTDQDEAWKQALVVYCTFVLLTLPKKSHPMYRSTKTLGTKEKLQMCTFVLFFFYLAVLADFIQYSIVHFKKAKLTFCVSYRFFYMSIILYLFQSYCMCTEHIAVVLLWSLVDCLAIYFSGSQCTFLVYCTVCVCVCFFSQKWLPQLLRIEYLRGHTVECLSLQCNSIWYSIIVASCNGISLDVPGVATLLHDLIGRAV